MNHPDKLSRRAMLCRVAVGLSLGSGLLRDARAAGPKLPLLKESDPEAKAVHYVENAGSSKEAASGANCANCSLYSSTSDSDGSCTLFKGKLVKAAGWCNSWSGL